ncbi:hypothetical protein [Pseudomonas sp. UBA4617]|nr:hypothetical protein [Pseudomonas sp. UBA4617]
MSTCKCSGRAAAAGLAHGFLSKIAEFGIYFAGIFQYLALIARDSAQLPV